MVNAAFINQPSCDNLASDRALSRRRFPVPGHPRGDPGLPRSSTRASASVFSPKARSRERACLGPFYRGIEVILQGRDDVPVFPVAIDNLWGSIFSRSGGRFFRKRPRGLRRDVNVVFGPPVPTPVTAASLRQALMETHGPRLRAPAAIPADPLESIDPALPCWRALRRSGC